MNFKKWVKSVQTAGYNGVCTVNVKTMRKITQIFVAVSEKLNFTCCNKVAILSDIVNTNDKKMAKNTGNKIFQRPSSNWSKFMKTFFFTTAMNLSDDIPNKNHRFKNSVKLNPSAK